MSQSSTVKARHVSGADDEGLSRPPGARPQLLSQLPGCAFTSPGVIAGIIVAEFFYALVLFAMMSGAKKEEPQLASVAPEVIETTKVADVAPPKEEPEAPAKVESPPEPAPKPEPTPAPAAVTSPPHAAEPPKPAAPAPVPATPAPPPATPPVAVANADANTQPSAPPVLNTLGPLGPLVDPLGDCRVEKGGDGVTIHVPATPHVFFPDREVADAPRALAPVLGDFVAQVKVTGSIRPGTKPIADLHFTFQGAGLILWQGPGTYVRFERAVAYTADRGTVHQVMVETCKDGRLGKTVSVPAREGTIALRMERRGGELNCTYTSDGKTWIRVKQFTFPLTGEVSVGISASNASAKPFSASFEDFSLKTLGKGG